MPSMARKAREPRVSTVASVSFMRAKLGVEIVREAMGANGEAMGANAFSELVIIRAIRGGALRVWRFWREGEGAEHLRASLGNCLFGDLVRFHAMFGWVALEGSDRKERMSRKPDTRIGARVSWRQAEAARDGFAVVIAYGNYKPRNDG